MSALKEFEPGRSSVVRAVMITSLARRGSVGERDTWRASADDGGRELAENWRDAEGRWAPSSQQCPETWPSSERCKSNEAAQERTASEAGEHRLAKRRDVSPGIDVGFMPEQIKRVTDLSAGRCADSPGLERTCDLREHAVWQSLRCAQNSRIDRRR